MIKILLFFIIILFSVNAYATENLFESDYWIIQKASNTCYLKSLEDVGGYKLIIRFQKKTWDIVLNNKGYNLKEKNYGYLNIAVDKKHLGVLSAKGIGEKYLSLHYKGFMKKFIRPFMNGDILTISRGKTKVQFSLKGSKEAMQNIVVCLASLNSKAISV